MTRKSTFALTLILALTMGAFLLTAAPASPAHAQQPGKAFRALWFLVLPAPEMLLPTDTWGGSIFATLEGESLLGGIAGNDGKETDYPSFTIFKDGQYTICFAKSVAAGWGGASDCADSFTYEVPHALVTWQSTDALGDYTSTATIVRGTGRFASASGHLHITAPFLVWTPDGGTTWLGRGSGVITGTIYGVK